MAAFAISSGGCRLGLDARSLLQTGKTPALPGRQSMFDSSWRPSKKLQT
jgi:hypothetical protein